MKFTIKEGNYEKMGAIAVGKTVIFTFSAEQEEDCSLLLYEKKTDELTKIEVPKEYCFGSLRSVCVLNIDWKKYNYNYEIAKKVVIDPYARKIVGREKWNCLVEGQEERCIKCGIGSAAYEWKNEIHVRVPKEEMIMYKLHVRGFSMDSSARGMEKGTFLAVSKKIPYLKELGVTTVELMPVYEFEEMEQERKISYPVTTSWEEQKDDLVKKENTNKKKKVNFWGYTKSNYFAIKESYGKKNASLELKQLVEALHMNHMEIILEMYFDDKENHNLILEALRYLTREYHVDGFHLLGNNLPITAITQDALLSRAKIFYTGYALELLENDKNASRLFVYNDEYLYPVRKMLNHLNGDLQEFSGQQRKQDVGQGFVNYIASNNGFTLADVFAYERKHNEANGEQNSDGNDWNFSANAGVEGATRVRHINELREKQMRNAFACMLLAQGVPLIWSGDEIANSQLGNNNAYCQDNEVGWINWKNQKKYTWLITYVEKLTSFRKNHPVLSLRVPMKMNDYAQKGLPDLSYHQKNAWMLGFVPEQQTVGMLYCGAYADIKSKEKMEDVYIAYNFYATDSILALPKLSQGKKWHLVMDTSIGKDAFLEKKLVVKNQHHYPIKGQTIAILVGI